MIDTNSKINEQLEILKIKETYLEVINSFALILFEAQSINDIVWAVTKNAIAKLNYYDCVIYLYDETEDVLVQRAAYGPKNVKNKVYAPITIKPKEGVVGSVFTSGVGEIIADTSKDSRYLIDDAPRLSEITIPLREKGKIVGVIDSEHPEANFFTEQDFNMLTTVAAMVSSRLEQARSNEEVIRYQQNLERLVNEQTAELEEANDILKAQNKEKEILIKEIHHRVKNNMQIMISLLNLQMNGSGSAQEQKVLGEFQNRIRTMAIIHERLYLEKDISSISIDEYVSELTSNLLSSYKKNDLLSVSTNIEHIQLDIDTAIPLGLIINELMTNTLKHAFTDGRKGEISLNLGFKKGEISFTYTDNGVGYKPEIKEEGTFGLELIEILVDQLNGSLVTKSDDGVKVTIQFDPSVVN